MNNLMTVRISGPLFESATDDIIDEYLDEVSFAVAGQVLSEIQDILNVKIKRPTPYYETQVQIVPLVAEHTSAVNDSGVVYGPWLEGVSERNQQTRFKGYHAFRNGLARAEGEVDRALVRPNALLVQRLGG